MLNLRLFWVAFASFSLLASPIAFGNDVAAPKAEVKASATHKEKHVKKMKKETVEKASEKAPEAAPVPKQ